MRGSSRIMSKWLCACPPQPITPTFSSSIRLASPQQKCARVGEISSRQAPLPEVRSCLGEAGSAPWPDSAIKKAGCEVTTICRECYRGDVQGQALKAANLLIGSDAAAPCDAARG